MRVRYASVIATIFGIDIEVVKKRQPCDGWIEVEGDTITLHLTGEPVGPITAVGSNMRLAFFDEAAGGECLGTLHLVHPVGIGGYVPLS